MNRLLSTLFFTLYVVVLSSTDAVSQDHPARVRVAAISFEPTKLDLAGNCDRLESYFRQAAKGGAKIAVACDTGFFDLVGDLLDLPIMNGMSPEELPRVHALGHQMVNYSLPELLDLRFDCLHCHYFDHQLLLFIHLYLLYSLTLAV